MADIDGLLVDTLKTALVTPTGGSQDTLANHLGLLAPKDGAVLTGQATIESIAAVPVTASSPGATYSWDASASTCLELVANQATAVTITNLPTGNIWRGTIFASSAAAGPWGLTFVNATIAAPGSISIPTGGDVISIGVEYDGTTAIAYPPHVGEGGGAHAAATTSVAGFLSASDKTKLDGIATSATANPNAIESDQAGEIAALTEKSTPVSADLLLIEDSAASNAKKKIQIGNLPHSSTTMLQDLQAKIRRVWNFGLLGLTVTGGTTLGWRTSTLSIDGSATMRSSVDRPWAKLLPTAAASNQSLWLGGPAASVSTTAAFLYGEIDEYWFDFQFLATPDENYRFGFSRDPYTTPTHGVYLELLTTDTYWHMVTNPASGSDVRNATSITKDTNRHVIGIKRTATPGWIFNVDGVDQSEITTGLPTLTDYCCPHYMANKVATTQVAWQVSFAAVQLNVGHVA